MKAPSLDQQDLGTPSRNRQLQTKVTHPRYFEHSTAAGLAHKVYAGCDGYRPHIFTV